MGLVVIVFVLFLPLSGALLSDVEQVLKSPRLLASMYNDFKRQHNLKFRTPNEDKLRLRVFRQNLLIIADMKGKSTAKFAPNFFSTLTPAESQLYYGYNSTLHNKRRRVQYFRPKRKSLQHYKRKSWLLEKAVTRVMNQDGVEKCGACYIFSAVAAIETNYKIASGVLKEFSEQECLDCHVETKGCLGGYPDQCFQLTLKSGHLARLSDYEYTGVRSKCRSESTPNGLVSHRLTGFGKIQENELNHIQALNEGAITVSFQVYPAFKQYACGILSFLADNSLPSSHVTAAVGYGRGYIMIKNSWGSLWGEQGFARFSRDPKINCRLYHDSTIPTFARTGRGDYSKSDPYNNYDPTVDCVDSSTHCGRKDCLRYETRLLCKRKCQVCDHDLADNPDDNDNHDTDRESD